MQEPYGEGPTTHPDPKPCASHSNVRREALEGEDAGRVLSCEIKKSLGPTLLTEAEGNIGRGATGEPLPARAQSETPHMHGHLLHGNREAPVVSGVDGTPERLRRNLSVIIPG